MLTNETPANSRKKMRRQDTDGNENTHYGILGGLLGTRGACCSLSPPPRLGFHPQRISHDHSFSSHPDRDATVAIPIGNRERNSAIP
mmetsp:Transcript_5656/g.14125  ORF Transcript_5656/g.14125 Transcript_5656/m.14125 type:complete len:87 (+) Transcript_5656:2204-2464(+)